jgi:hypothetical protein
LSQHLAEQRGIKLPKFPTQTNQRSLFNIPLNRTGVTNKDQQELMAFGKSQPVDLCAYTVCCFVPFSFCPVCSASLESLYLFSLSTP